MSIADLVYCPDGVNHAFLIEEVQANRKRKYKSYKCPRCKEELVIAPPVG